MNARCLARISGISHDRFVSRSPRRHRAAAQPADRGDGEDWIAHHFFSGGAMPSHHLNLTRI